MDVKIQIWPSANKHGQNNRGGQENKKHKGNPTGSK